MHKISIIKLFLRKFNDVYNCMLEITYQVDSCSIYTGHQWSLYHSKHSQLFQDPIHTTLHTYIYLQDKHDNSIFPDNIVLQASYVSYVCYYTHLEPRYVQPTIYIHTFIWPHYITIYPLVMATAENYYIYKQKDGSSRLDQDITGTKEPLIVTGALKSCCFCPIWQV